MKADKVSVGKKLWVRQSDGSYLLVDDGCQFDNYEFYDDNDGYMTSPPKVDDVREW
jgi:hypothetical protein